MRRAAVLVLAGLAMLHGLVSLAGAAAGLGVGAPVSDVPLSPAEGALWLVAALLAFLAAVLLVLRRRGWWLACGVAAVASQVAIATAWPAAAAGTAVNVVLVLAAAYGWRSSGPGSPRARFHRSVQAVVGSPGEPGSPDHLEEADLRGLPPLVAAYVRRTGSVGRRRVTGFRARISGRIRGGPDRPWMAFSGEQLNTYEPGTARYFHLDATMKGLPVDVLHVLEGGRATMRAELLAAIPVMDASGPLLDQAETVTLLNDVCLFAPGALPWAPITWESVDEHRVRATYSSGEHTVSAVLVFDEAGDLRDFTSDDRLAASASGRDLVPMRWSTPVTDYRDVDGRRLVAAGEGWWHPDSGGYCYLELTVDSFETLTARPWATGSEGFPTGVPTGRGS